MGVSEGFGVGVSAGVGTGVSDKFDARGGIISNCKLLISNSVNPSVT